MSFSQKLTHRRVAAIAASSLPAVLALSVAGTAHAATPDATARLQQAWRGAITQAPVPREGCFAASYPDRAWHEVACKAAPARPYLPRRGAASRTVGNGNDYAAVTSSLTASAVGSFPTVSGVKSEKGYGGAANTYSLQLNSGFMTTAACNGVSGCLSWEQFVYSSSETSAFMQYWLINYGNTCPSGGGWMQYQGSCYKNSAAVSVPQLAITGLSGFSVSGAAVSGGNDTLVFSTASKAYSTSGKDSVVDLATAWTQSEFNIVGDGGGSAAKFNKGSSVGVEIALKDGGTAAPKCQSNDGTTGETNNLTLGSCSTSSGATPAIKFTESN